VSAPAARGLTARDARAADFWDKFRSNRRCFDGDRALVPAHWRSWSRALSHPAGERLPVPRRVKDFIDISEYTSLDDLIRYLETVRDNLPAEHQAEMKIRGDEVFGRRLTITYFREQTPEEVELETKYSSKDNGTIDDLRRKLDEVPFKFGNSKSS
jgi:hypothetical protein